MYLYENIASYTFLADKASAAHNNFPNLPKLSAAISLNTLLNQWKISNGIN